MAHRTQGQKAWSLVAVSIALPACIGNIGDRGGDAAHASEPGVDADVAAVGLRRLSSYEYDTTLRDLLLDDVGGAALNLQADQRTPFDNDYQSQEVSQAYVEGAELLAGDVADRLLVDSARRDLVVGCEPVQVRDEVCFRQFLESFGARALRRPLTEDQVASRMSLLDFADEAGDFDFAVGLAVRSFLVDTAFLYRIEIGEEIAPGLRRLDGWEVASRLSYLVWGTMPDDELFELARQGELASVDEVRAAATRMLDDPRALVQIERFHALWMGYEGLVSAGPLGSDMLAETTALFEKVVGEGRPWIELFRWPETYATKALAEHYGLEAAGEDPAWIEYGASGRAGLLSHGSFLAVGGQAEVTSPTMRGQLIRELLLCQPIPERPKDVPPPPGPGEGAVCKTDIQAQHVTPGCAACHEQMDGIGFGLEQFDATGAFRTHQPDDLATDEIDESECELATSGQLVLDDAALPFSGPGELGTLLSERDELVACLARQLYRFAVGRSELDDVDEGLIDALTASLASRDFAFEDVVLELVSQQSFLMRRDATEEK